MPDDERRVLDEMEEHLRTADPAFLARMSASQPPFPTSVLVGLLLFVTVPAATLLVGATVPALTGAAVLAVLGAVVIRRWRRRRYGREG